jgi:hypothetical protein
MREARSDRVLRTVPADEVAVLVQQPGPHCVRHGVAAGNQVWVVTGWPPGAECRGAAGSTDGQPAIFFSDRHNGADSTITTVGAHRGGQPGSPDSGPTW